MKSFYYRVVYGSMNNSVFFLLSINRINRSPVIKVASLLKCSIRVSAILPASESWLESSLSDLINVLRFLPALVR
jgi:hypothetical protein